MLRKVLILVFIMAVSLMLAQEMQEQPVERTDPKELVATISPNGGQFSRTQQVMIRAAKGNVYYTTDGKNPTQTSNLYNQPINIDKNTTLMVRVYADDGVAGEVISANFSFIPDKPVIAPNGGSYTIDQNITITSATAGVEIRYTTDGREPNRRSVLYSQPVPVNGNTVIRAIVFRDGWNESEAASAEFTFNVPRPSFSPAGGSFTSPQAVTMQASVTDAQIRYTTDGSEPTVRSSLYSQPVSISANSTLKVKAFKTNWEPSEAVSANYTFTVPVPQIQPAGGVFNEPQYVSVVSPMEGVLIRYTTDGSEPNETSGRYDSQVLIDKRTNFRAKAFRQNWNASEATSAIFSFRVATPEFTPAAGSYNHERNISISCATTNAIIRYTTDGSTPTENSQRYQSPFNLDKSTELRVKAYRDGWLDSDEVSGRFAFVVANPAFNPPGDTYDLIRNVALATETNNTAIYYTIDGSQPTESSIRYTAPIFVANDLTIRARAYRDGWSSSQTMRADYIIKAAMISVSAGSFVPFNGTERVTLTRDFYIGKYPVTQEQWVELMGSNPSKHKEHFGKNHPVEWISWYDAVKYCNLLSIKEGYRPVYSIKGSTNPRFWGDVPEVADSTWDAMSFDCSANGYRLPTSAEWEYAARSAGKDSFDYAGGSDISEVGWFSGNTQRTTAPVGQKQPNSLGLHDMSGNVWEWCWDINIGRCTATGEDPQGLKEGSTRILRGGSFVSNPQACVIGNVFTLGAYQAYPSRGLRIVRNAR